MNKKGIVCQDKVSVGSKSERVAFYLKEDDGTKWNLRLHGKSPFVKEPWTSLLGKRLNVQGRESNNDTFFVSGYIEETTQTEENTV